MNWTKSAFWPMEGGCCWFKRTIEDWKIRFLWDNRMRKLSFNRAIREFKRGYRCRCDVRSSGFNRTIEELKPITCKAIFVSSTGFNRTIEELKLGCNFIWGTILLALIEPLRNWNNAQHPLTFIVLGFNRTIEELKQVELIFSRSILLL